MGLLRGPAGAFGEAPLPQGRRHGALQSMRHPGLGDVARRPSGSTEVCMGYSMSCHSGLDHHRTWPRWTSMAQFLLRTSSDNNGCGALHRCHKVYPCAGSSWGSKQDRVPSTLLPSIFALPGSGGAPSWREREIPQTNSYRRLRWRQHR